MSQQAKSTVEPSFSAHLIRPFVKALRNHPALPARLMESLSQQDPDKRTPVSVCEAMLQGAVEMTGDPHIGIKAALSADQGDYEVLEYTVTSASTVREAIECLIRYMRLVNDAARFRLDVIGPTAQLDLSTSIPLSQVSVEFKVAAVCVTARRWITHPQPYLEIWFTHDEPGDLTDYRAAFGNTKLVFRAPKDALIMDTARLEQPLTHADQNLHHVLRTHADQLLQELPRTDSLSERVRKHILDTMPDGTVSADRVASLLHMSRRTLTRHLAEESTTFRDLLEDTRQRMARQYLATTNMSASDVAFLLGFSEAAPFVRAFKRWTGKTPTEFRREQRR